MWMDSDGEKNRPIHRTTNFWKLSARQSYIKITCSKSFAPGAVLLRKAWFCFVQNHFSFNNSLHSCLPK